MKVHVRSLITEDGWVTDEMITASLLTIVNQSDKGKNVLVIDVSAMNDICNKTYIYKSKVLSKVDFSHYNAVMGGYCYKKCHWILVIVETKKSQILYIDPKKNVKEKQELSRIKKNWNAYSSYQYCAGYWKNRFTWDVVSPPHDLQDDNNSCGVFVMQFAKQYINDMPLSLKMYDIAVVRMEMGEMVLNNSEDISEYCRTCSSKTKYEGTWIGCDNCWSWYHLRCVNRHTNGDLTVDDVEKINFIGPCCSEEANYYIEFL